MLMCLWNVYVKFISSLQCVKYETVQSFKDTFFALYSDYIKLIYQMEEIRK